jgi:hypothetical protein
MALVMVLKQMGQGLKGNKLLFAIKMHRYCRKNGKAVLEDCLIFLFKNVLALDH